LQYKKVKAADGNIFLLEIGELLEPLEGGELSFHLLRFGALSEATSRTYFLQLIQALVHF
jgi:hypothetical protein